MEVGILIIVGILSGISVYKYVPYVGKGGLTGDILLGVLGALEGGLGSNILKLQFMTFGYRNILLGIAGAIILLSLQRFLARDDRAISVYLQQELPGKGGEPA